MFGRKSHRHSHLDTLVGPDSKVQGDLHFAGGCHIDGAVLGNVTCEDDESELSISENGRIDGGVTVPYVVLNGTVKGDVYANARVELGPTARVIGNVYYNLIEMAIGAEINGKLVHRPDARPGNMTEPTGDTSRMPAPSVSGS